MVPVLLEARDVEFVPASGMFLAVMETFHAQRLSFRDAAIITAARHRDARFVTTFDRDFRQVEGLAVVPACVSPGQQIRRSGETPAPRA